MKFFFTTFLIICFSCPILSQSMQSGDIVTHMNSIINSLPGADGDDYAVPTAGQITTWNGILVDIFAGNYATAATAAATIGYDLIEFSDNTNSETYYILETTSMGTNYWGTYVYNPNACRSELVIMSPHPKKDFNTGKQGIYCFKLTDALFYMLSGTNRCNSPSLSACSGTTTVCSGGASEAYRISDMAHVIDAIWQETTEYLTDNQAGTYFAQLHGFFKLESDPYVIMSNGTQITPNPDKIVTLKDELLVVDGTLTFEIAHLNLAWTRLRGFSNTNGRYINGNTSANSCTTNAGATNGRFLHLEQEKTKLRDDSTGWHKMAIALGETFNDGGCASIVPLAVELSDFRASDQMDHILVKWTTQSEVNHAYFDLEKSINGTDFQSIARIDGQGNSFEMTNYIYEDFAPNFGWNFYRLVQVDFHGEEEYSEIIQVQFGESQNTKIWFDNGFVEVSSDPNFNRSFYLYNAIGQRVFEYFLNENHVQIPVSHLPKGVYFYQMGKDLSGKIFIP